MSRKYSEISIYNSGNRIYNLKKFIYNQEEKRNLNAIVDYLKNRYEIPDIKQDLKIDNVIYDSNLFELKTYRNGNERLNMIFPLPIEIILKNTNFDILFNFKTLSLFTQSEIEYVDNKDLRNSFIIPIMRLYQPQELIELLKEFLFYLSIDKNFLIYNGLVKTIFGMDPGFGIKYGNLNPLKLPEEIEIIDKSEVIKFIRNNTNIPKDYSCFKINLFWEDKNFEPTDSYSKARSIEAFKLYEDNICRLRPKLYNLKIAIIENSIKFLQNNINEQMFLNDSLGIIKNKFTLENYKSLREFEEISMNIFKEKNYYHGGISCIIDLIQYVMFTKKMWENKALTEGINNIKNNQHALIKFLWSRSSQLIEEFVIHRDEIINLCDKKYKELIQHLNNTPWDDPAKRKFLEAIDNLELYNDAEILNRKPILGKPKIKTSSCVVKDWTKLKLVFKNELEIDVFYETIFYESVTPQELNMIKNNSKNLKNSDSNKLIIAWTLLKEFRDSKIVPFVEQATPERIDRFKQHIVFLNKRLKKYFNYNGKDNPVVMIAKNGKNKRFYEEHQKQGAYSYIKIVGIGCDLSKSSTIDLELAAAKNDISRSLNSSSISDFSSISFDEVNPHPIQIEKPKNHRYVTMLMLKETKRWKEKKELKSEKK